MLQALRQVPIFRAAKQVFYLVPTKEISMGLLPLLAPTEQGKLQPVILVLVAPILFMAFSLINMDSLTLWAPLQLHGLSLIRHLIVAAIKPMENSLLPKYNPI